MSIDPRLEEQELLAETFRRARSRMSARERWSELALAAGFVAAAAAVWWLRPPGPIAVLPALLCVAVLALATRVRFDTPLGFTVATQLAFVPLLFAVPVALAPFAVVVALLLAQLPDLCRGTLTARALGLSVGNASFALGPAAVFALAGTAPAHATAAVLGGALLAQFAVDFGVSAVRFAIGRGAGFGSQLRESWVYGIDAAFSLIGLLVAVQIQRYPLVALAPVPLLGLLVVFARERHQRLEGVLELNQAYRGTALVLGDVIDADDGYTGEHSRAVVELALAVGDRLTLDAERRRNLEFGALLHDVGKVAIPKEVLNKPGALDPGDWALIKTHTILGHQMLERVGGFMGDVGVIVRSHHERWDGGGYPDGLAGEHIPLEARIIACCDTWNAMRTDRVYRPALSHEDALAELLAVAGSQLDARIVRLLVEIVAGAPPADEPPSPGQSREASDAPAAVQDGMVEDVRSTDPVERLLEDSWESRAARPRRREILAEALAAALFLAGAVSLAAPALAAGRVHLGPAVLLVVVYAIAASAVKIPIGAGYAVPSYLVLVPMLLLLPPSTVPLLAAAGLVLSSAARTLARRSPPAHLLFSVPDAFYAFGPALVLSAAGVSASRPTPDGWLALDYLAAFAAGCLVDLVASSVRETFATGLAPRLQARVIMVVWLVDALLAPGGLLVAYAARQHPMNILLVLPVIALLALAVRDRNTRIAEAQHRLGLIAGERTRLQAAVHRLGDALTAKLDLRALTDVVLHGAIDALDASAGRLTLHTPAGPLSDRSTGAAGLGPLLQAAGRSVILDPAPRQLEREDSWALTVPLSFTPDGAGALTVARERRPFREDERRLLIGLAERAQHAVSEILSHEALRQAALTDPLTRLGNRRQLSEDLARQLGATTAATPMLLMLFDLDGFKIYNDMFGHPAGDALLALIGTRLAAAVAPRGSAYRLGGDEFCVLMPADPDELPEAVAAAIDAFEERGETFRITTSCGTALVPHEATTADYALQLADKRMYGRKHRRRSGAREQAHDVLANIIKTRQPELSAHAAGVTALADPIGRRLGLDAEQLDELVRAAGLHDVGNVAIPEAILAKPGPLDADEWTLIRQHTVLGERILSAAPALRPVATIVRATHERWDGAGYPDGLRGEDIPLAARIIAVCEAYQAMITGYGDRPARSPEQARDELSRESGRQFDPAAVRAFIEELDRPMPAEPGESAGAALVAEVVSQVVSHARGLLRAGGG